MRILVTGGAGFIGSAVCRHLVASGAERIVNVDKLTYAGNLDSVRVAENYPSYVFRKADICDDQMMLDIMRAERIDAVMHLAAESHVDRSIDGPGAFVETNVVGTFRLLNAALAYWRGLPSDQQERFRFHHISTDEVFGDLSTERVAPRLRRSSRKNIRPRLSGRKTRGRLLPVRRRFRAAGAGLAREHG